MNKPKLTWDNPEIVPKLIKILGEDRYKAAITTHAHEQSHGAIRIKKRVVITDKVDNDA